MNILLVDDEPTYRVLAADFLRTEGWQVFTAGHGGEALDVLAKQKVDVVVSDIYMPVMDGLKFRKAVREMPAFAQIPFLFISAYDDEYTMTAIKDARIDGFLRKGHPMAYMKAWILYLMTPVHQRPLMPPVPSAPPNLRQRRDPLT